MRYLVRERLFDIKDDFWVTDEHGRGIFYVNAKFISLHHTLVLEDASGRKLASIKHRLLTFTDAIDIEHDGAVAATVHRAVFSPLHHRAFIDLHDGGGKLEAVGNIIDKDFEIRDGTTWWPGSRGSGSGSATPTGSRWRPARTTRS